MGKVCVSPWLTWVAKENHKHDLTANLRVKYGSDPSYSFLWCVWSHSGPPGTHRIQSCLETPTLESLHPDPPSL